MSNEVAVGQPLSLWVGRVLEDWLDYNGHMTEHRYLQVFGESSDAFYAMIGVDFALASEGAYFTLETHIRHIAECRLGTELRTATQVLGYDEKRLHLYHELFDGMDRRLATGEHLSIHVRHSKSCRASGSMLERIGAVLEAQKEMPQPRGTGSVLAKALEFARD